MEQFLGFRLRTFRSEIDDEPQSNLVWRIVGRSTQEETMRISSRLRTGGRPNMANANSEALIRNIIETRAKALRSVTLTR